MKILGQCWVSAASQGPESGFSGLEDFQDYGGVLIDNRPL